MSNTLFPVFLKTDTARFLVVGGGNVGLEKTETLLKQNPDVAIVIVGTIIYPRLKELIGTRTNITAHERPFEKSDLDGIDYVIIGTDNPAINLEIRQLARQEKIKVNAADQPALCDFYLGSIITKGNLKIAISTNGKSPVLARRMREYFEEAIPESINDSIDNLNAFRNNHKGNFKEKLADLNKATQGLSATENKGVAKKCKPLWAKISLSFILFFTGYGLSIVVSPSFVVAQIQLILNKF